MNLHIKPAGSHRHCRVLGALLLLLLLVGCGRETERTTVSFMVFGDPAELAAYNRLVAAFEEAFPEIDVELRHIPGQAEYRQRLATDFAGGAPPDVMLLNYRRFATFAAHGGLEPLGGMLAVSRQIATADFYPIAIEAFTFEEQIWCIPQNVSSLVVYYNRGLFDAAGLAYPAAGWTWDQFLAAARVLTRDLDGDGRTDQYGAGLEPNLFRLAPFIWSNGGEIVDDVAIPTRLTLDSPASLEAFRWFVDLQVQERVVPDAAAEAAETSESRFLNGRLAMFFNSRRGVPAYRAVATLDWDVAPLPRGREEAGILHSDGYCMAAAASEKGAAWTFIEYANSPAGQRLVAKTGRTVPSLISVAESAEFLAPQLSPANSAVFIETIPALRRVPILSTWAGVEETASREITRAFYGLAGVEEAAATAAELTQPYLAPPLYAQ